MKKKLLTLLGIILFSSISIAQTYTEIFEGGWGRAAHSCKPALIDLDNDGLLDLIVGEYLGNLTHYEQNSSGSNDFTLVTENFQDIHVGNKSKPIFVDINDDGLEDLLVGDTDGGIHYFQRDNTTFVEEKMITSIQPPTFKLLQNYPNPFNPETKIQYNLPKSSFVTLVVYDLLGKTIKKLVQQKKQAGFHSVVWDGRDQNGEIVASGVYIYQLKTESFEKSKKLIYLR
jgi:hypothetical protein